MGSETCYAYLKQAKMDTLPNPDPMQEVAKLAAYVYQQLNAGLHPDEIAAQLRASGWPEPYVTQAFASVQSQVVPSAAGATPLNAQTVKRGRTKTGWLLFKQSMKIIRTNESLVRYVIMSAVMGIGLAIIFGIIFLVGSNTLLVKTVDSAGTTNYSASPAGYVVVFIYYVLAYFIVNLYAAGLVANTIDIFHGQSKPYKEYMKLARSKAGTLFMFSVIEATIGMILRAIAERSRLLGRIIVWIVGAAWSIARLFVIPVIVTTDESAVSSIKTSTLLLKATWGENIIGRLGFGIATFLIYLLLFVIAIPVVIATAALGGVIGAAVGVSLVVVAFLVVTIFFSAASSVLNTALFYYAQYKQVPAAYDPELMNSVFVPGKKRRGIFGL